MKPNLLSSQYNLSLGFTPAILAMLLSGWMGADVATYLGTGMGIGIITIEKWRGKAPITWVLLYSTTGMLILLSLFNILFGACCPKRLLPLTLEISTMLPPAFLLLNRKRWTEQLSRNYSIRMQRLLLGLEASTASSKVILSLGVLHFLIISVCTVAIRPMNDLTIGLLYEAMPPALYLAGIVLNQIGIRYFNRLITQTTYLTVVNEQGDVIGKTKTWKAPANKVHYLIPVIRIAIVTQGMLYLKPRSMFNRLSPGKLDLTIEGPILFGETIEQSVERLVKRILPSVPKHTLHFSLKHPFKEDHTQQLVYLFLMDIDSEPLLQKSLEKAGKLWTLQQVDDNLNQRLFSNCFEYEYECLKEVIYTREKYKES